MISARGALLVFFGSALCLTVRLAVAEEDFRRDPSGPQSPAWLRVSNLASDESSTDQLQAVVRLNPLLSPAWIALGLDAEADGDLAGAEADLLQAERVDRQYVPAWTLANFYFRRGDLVKFWPWAERTATLTFDDYRPLLRLADALEPSPKAVVARLGRRRRLVRAYMDLLIGAGRLEEAQSLANEPE